MTHPLLRLPFMGSGRAWREPVRQYVTRVNRTGGWCVSFSNDASRLEADDPAYYTELKAQLKRGITFVPNSSRLRRTSSRGAMPCG